jgi:hypothetical protein
MIPTCDRHLPGSCLAGVAQLTRLTSLTLQGDWRSQQQQLQQLLEAPLPLQQLHLENSDMRARLPPLNMARLTQLKQLSCSAVFDDDATVLPAQLQRLYLTDCGTGQSSGLQPVLMLQQLQHLEVTFQEQQPADVTLERAFLLRDALTRLALLPALQHVKLEYAATQEWPLAALHLATLTARAWGQMPQLRELRVRFSYGGGMEAIIAGLAAATSLTMLSIRPGASWHFKLDHSYNAAFTEVLPKLQQLQHLELVRCTITSPECIAAIGQLTQLTELRLEGSRMIPQRLMLLTGLKQLQQLGVDKTPRVTESVLEQFWAVLRQQS